MDPNVLAGFGNWDGDGVAFGVYARNGGILGGTGVCLYQDTNGDKKLTCGELTACAKKTGGSKVKYVTGGASQNTDDVPPPGIICGTIKNQDGDGNSHEACVLAQTQPGSELDVCGLKDCCPCIECPEEESDAEEDVEEAEGGKSLSPPKGHYRPTNATQFADPGYAWKDASGNDVMRVNHDVMGTDWTIFAANSLLADEIHVILVAPDGAEVSRTPLSLSFGSAGITATYSGQVQDEHFLVMSVRRAGEPQLNFFVNSTTRSDAGEAEYYEAVATATFQ